MLRQSDYTNRILVRIMLIEGKDVVMWTLVFCPEFFYPL